MLLDSQGTLILSPALSNGNNAKEKTTGGAIRRFHLSEFRTPGIPDVEMQELANSVVLNFIEGGALQIACEDRAGQMRVLARKFPASFFGSQLTREQSFKTHTASGQPTVNNTRQSISLPPFSLVDITTQSTVVSCQPSCPSFSLKPSF